MGRVGSIRFWLAFLFLNSVMVLRFPEQVDWWTYLMPSLDVVGLLVAFILLGAWQRQLPRALNWTLLGFFLLSITLRLADGVEQGAFLRYFILSLDLPLVPEFVRLFYATVPLPLFAIACVALGALFVGLGFALSYAFEVARIELASPARARAFCWFVSLFALAAVFHPPMPMLQPSMMLRWIAEAEGALELPKYRANQQARIAGVGRGLDARPHDLQKLRGQNVYVFLIESYGQTVLDRPELFARVAPEYRRAERELSAAGFQIASRVLDSPVYGGRSWLAQTTLLTGVPTRDQLQFELLRQAEPRTLAQVFSAAGYRTVLAQPGTVRVDARRDLLQFDRRYAASDLDYHGPRYGWATMPDQFVLEAVRRRELSGSSTQPRFLTYALISSHVRWSKLPPVVDDWTQLGDGSLFSALPITEYATSWLVLSAASTAYADAIVYDLDVLRRYLLEFVKDDSLVIILGDHQPHADLTRHGLSFGVPVHVLSRNAAFVAPFRARGYTPGMVAEEALPHPGLDSLLPDLVSDLSLGSERSVR